MGFQPAVYEAFLWPKIKSAACENLELVSKLLGHKSEKTTQRYADALLDRKIEAVNRTVSVF